METQDRRTNALYLLVIPNVLICAGLAVNDFQRSRAWSR